MGALPRILSLLRQDVKDFQSQLPNRSNLPPMITFTFDDCFQTNHDAFQLFRQYGVRATYFIQTSMIDQWSTNLTPAQIQEMANEGHEIGSHSVTHPRFREDEPEPLTDAEVLYELSESKKTLQAITGKTCLTFGVPNSSTDTRLEILSSGFYEFSAIGTYDTYLPYGQRRSHVFNRCFIDKLSRGLVYAKTKVDEVVAARGWLIFGLHQLTDLSWGDVSEEYLFPKADLEELLQYLEQYRPELEVVTFYEGAKRLTSHL